jgi:3-oxoacyl-[acyl-carrier protein] reductase
VSDAESARSLVDEAGELDVLVNNAGVTRDGLLVRMSDEDWKTVIDTNLASCFYTCRAAVRGMMKRRAGSIVNISSVVGIHGNWGQTNYAASKAGIIGFTKALARELGIQRPCERRVPGYVKASSRILPEDATARCGEHRLGRLGDRGRGRGGTVSPPDDARSCGRGLLVDGAGV